MALGGISDCEYVLFFSSFHISRGLLMCSFAFAFVGRSEENVEDHINAAPGSHLCFLFLDGLIFVFEVGSWEHSSFD